MCHLPDIVLFASELQAMSVLVTSGSSHQSAFHMPVEAEFREKVWDRKQRKRKTHCIVRPIELRENWKQMTTRYYQRSEDKIGKEMHKGYRKPRGLWGWDKVRISIWSSAKKLSSWKISMIHPWLGCLAHTLWAICNTGHAHWIVRWGGGMRGKWGVLENARKRWWIFIKLTAKPFIKIRVSHGLCNFRVLMLLQTHGLEHIWIIIMHIKRCTAKDWTTSISELQLGDWKLLTWNALSPQEIMWMHGLICCHLFRISDCTTILTPGSIST